MSAPLAVIGGKTSWYWTATMGLLCAIICVWRGRQKDEEYRLPKWLCVVETVFFAIAAAEMARWSTYCWEDLGQNTLVPLTLITLALLNVKKGTDNAANVSSILFLLAAAIYAVVLAAGAKEIKAEWIVTPMGVPQWESVFVFLLPSVCAFLPGKKVEWKICGILMTIFSVIINVWIFGTLSSRAAELSFPFYTFSRSLSFLGITERFESVISVALTIGFYSVITLMFAAIRSIWQQQKESDRGLYISAALAAGVVLLIKGIPPVILTAGAVILWIILPVLMEKLFQKKAEKWKKSA